MNTIKFLCVSTDAPHAKENVRETLPLPDPYLNEFRFYFNYREEERQDAMMDEDEESQIVLVPTADYISVQANHEPTDEEWKAVMQEGGLTEEQIEGILG